MKSIKLLIILLLSALFVQAQNYSQPMSSKDYGFYGQANFGSGRYRLTAASAYIELGDSLHSRKGLLFPRGDKDSVINPVRGLVFFDIPSGKLQVYDGSAWSPLGAGTGGAADGNNYPTGVTFTGGTLAIQRNGLSGISASLDGRYLQSFTETDPTALLKSNNLSDLVNAATARINLGATTVGNNLFTLTNPSALGYLRINADNTVTHRSYANVKVDLSLNNVPNVDATNPANIVQNSTNRFVTDAEKSTWNGKQNVLTLTTTGTSGAATLVGSTLNVPQYSGGGGGSGTVTQFNYTNANGFTGTVTNATTTPTLSLSLQNANGSQSGQLTATDWNKFNNKESAAITRSLGSIGTTTLTFDSAFYEYAVQTGNITLSLNSSGNVNLKEGTVIIDGDSSHSLTFGSKFVNGNNSDFDNTKRNRIYLQYSDLGEVVYNIIKTSLPDLVAPVIQSGATNVAGTVITLTYNETLFGTPSYTVSGGKTISSQVISGMTVVITVTPAYSNTDVITVSGGGVTDASGNAVATLTNYSVTNDVTLVPTDYIRDWEADILSLSDGASVASWTDRSTNADNAVQSTGTNKPTFKTNQINGHPVIRFDNTDDHLDFTEINPTNFTVVVVGKFTNKGILLGNNTVNRQMFAFDGGYSGDRLDLFGTAFTSYVSSDLLVAKETAAVYVVTVNGSTASWFQNGQPIGTATISGTFGVNSLGGLATQNAGWMGGDIGRVTIYNRTVTLSERQAIEDDRGTKYAVPITH